MKKRLFFILVLQFFIIFNCPISLAKTYSSVVIRNYAEKAPRKVEDHINTLVKYLVKPFDNDYDKAKAIAFWIASHINYDYYLYNSKRTELLKTYKGQEPEELLHSRAGICMDYAKLFTAMCDKARVKSGRLSGYAVIGNETRTAAKKNNPHAWNYFKYKGKIIYVDTTWMAAGKVKVGKRISRVNRKIALNNLKKANKKQCQINDFDEYYFDFTYEGEQRTKHVRRQEK